MKFRISDTCRYHHLCNTGRWDIGIRALATLATIPGELFYRWFGMLTRRQAARQLFAPAHWSEYRNACRMCHRFRFTPVSLKQRRYGADATIGCRRATDKRRCEQAPMQTTTGIFEMYNRDRQSEPADRPSRKPPFPHRLPVARRIDIAGSLTMVAAAGWTYDG